MLSSGAKAARTSAEHSTPPCEQHQSFLASDQSTNSDRARRQSKGRKVVVRVEVMVLVCVTVVVSVALVVVEDVRVLLVVEVVEVLIVEVLVQPTPAVLQHHSFFFSVHNACTPTWHAYR